ncbi:phosphate transport system regulatory protein PhoU [Agaricicola taiwanensis]|uniref:Phosphate-specific transport system accessory protein PhoU n=1 Tax=Agaricicola taiwanensis TaxID=591372 RepID=A0A8J2VKZ5_9RHOB|nr:phosphate signaling complex protein PhoU [Agaricicola taiwanensis]GGE30302.1 phosphate transport system regulatory protein PhoU [Agaricicola taiwanensis]
MSDHIVSSFDTELKGLAENLAEMGGLAEKMVGDSVSALLSRDGTLAQKVIAADKSVDQMQQRIEELAILTIARRQPMAVDLRAIVAALRVSNDLERIGDLAKNTAKRVIAIEGEFKSPKLFGGLNHMSELVLGQLKTVLDAYAERDNDRAVDVWRQDGEIDALYTSLFRELLTYMMEDPRNIGFCTHLLFCAKNIERIGDHATNIAETVHFLVTGQMLADDRPKQDNTSTTTIEFPG